jgi:hypothetical protein
LVRACPSELERKRSRGEKCNQATSPMPHEFYGKYKNIFLISRMPYLFLFFTG